MKNILLAVTVTLSVCGCASGPEKSVVSQNGEIKNAWADEGETKGYLFARGLGGANQTLDNKTQRLALSRNAAIVNAQYNMLAIVKGVQLAGGISVQAAMEKNSPLATRIKAAIKGAQITRTEWAADDGCVVTLRLSKTTLKTAGLRVEE